MDSQSRKHTLSAAGVLVAMGIIYGDIGTSPIYTLRFVVGSRLVSEELILGGLSLVFWTLTIITTIKYVYMALSADNKGEGGIFALYALVRRYKAGWVIFPAILGCCTLIADGFMTPAMSVTSAVEGIKTLMPEISDQTIITIVIIILVALFIFQQFGSSVVGKTFGPVMMVWFVFIGAIGAYHLSFNLAVLKAINPSYGVSLLIKYPGGFWILGAIFLCTTGAEAMYSDLGHCGKSNIRLGWGFVKLCLLLSYFGQGAWLLSTYEGKELGDTIPFFSMMPDWLLIFGVIIATMATVIASQALISGTFTLVNEAMKLKLWPATRVRYPSQMKGQIYIPAINWILMFGCILVVIFFKKSDDMQAAYGLAITVNMLMTSALLVYYFATVKKSTIRSSVLALVFFSIEGAFLISNLSKFSHGGWFSGSIALAFFLMMFILLRARELRDRHTEFVESIPWTRSFRKNAFLFALNLVSKQITE